MYVPQKAKVSGNSEYNVEMIGLQKACFLLNKPFLNLETGALGTEAVLTGIIPDTGKMTVRTGLLVTS